LRKRSFLSTKKNPAGLPHSLLPETRWTAPLLQVDRQTVQLRGKFDRLGNGLVVSLQLAKLTNQIGSRGAVNSELNIQSSLMYDVAKFY
jgi:hypothetical protein